MKLLPYFKPHGDNKKKYFYRGLVSYLCELLKRTKTFFSSRIKLFVFAMLLSGGRRPINYGKVIIIN
mgnify:CR=1 FL=1